MQAWIPVVSSRLYFWKSVFSFRVESILKWRVYIKLKVSWQRAFLWCMSQTSRDRVYSRCVRTHEKNSGDAVHRLGPIRSQHSLDRLEMVRWESVPTGFSACAWKLSSLLFSRCDWLPLGLRGWGYVSVPSMWQRTIHSLACEAGVERGRGLGRRRKGRGLGREGPSFSLLLPSPPVFAPTRHAGYSLGGNLAGRCSSGFFIWWNSWRSGTSILRSPLYSERFSLPQYP